MHVLYYKLNSIFLHFYKTFSSFLTVDLCLLQLLFSITIRPLRSLGIHLHNYQSLVACQLKFCRCPPKFKFKFKFSRQNTKPMGATKSHLSWLQVQPMKKVFSPLRSVIKFQLCDCNLIEFLKMVFIRVGFYLCLTTILLC